MDATPPPPARRVPLMGWIVVCVLVALGVALAIPPHQRAQMSRRHDRAAAAMDRIRQVEEAWRLNDCDRNGVADYWTRDVAGFH